MNKPWGLSLVPILSKIINMLEALLKFMFNKTCLCFGMLINKYTYMCVDSTYIHKYIFIIMLENYE